MQEKNRLKSVFSSSASFQKLNLKISSCRAAASAASLAMSIVDSIIFRTSFSTCIPSLTFRIPEPLSSYTVDDVDGEADADQSPAEFVAANDDDDRVQNPFKQCSWRLDVARQTERYLHRILH